MPTDAKSYEMSRDEAVEAAMKSNALSPDDKARCIELMKKYGPPTQWSGSVAARISPEDKKLCKRGWKLLTKEEKDEVMSAFEENFEKEFGSGGDDGAAEGDSDEKLADIDAKGMDAAKKLDEALSSGGSMSTVALRDAAIDKAMSMVKK